MIARNDGVAFELKVERWANRLGAATMRRVKLRGRNADWPHEVDVQATIPTAVMPYATAAAVLMLADVFFFAVELPVAGILFLGAAVGAALTALIRRVSPRCIWIECKSGEATITRLDVIKLAESADDVRANVDTGWRPTETWLVAKSRFDRDALAFARAKGVRCWIESAQGFVEVQKA